MTNEVFQRGIVHLDESELIALRLESGNYLGFEPDTGAECYVIEVSLYKKATRDYKMENVDPIQSNATGCVRRNAALFVVGQVILKVYRNDTNCRLDCKLVNEETGQPLLGRKA